MPPAEGWHIRDTIVLSTCGEDSALSTALRPTRLPLIDASRMVADGIADRTVPRRICRQSGDARHAPVIDRLPCSFDVAADQLHWLLTFLGADDLRHIFEGVRHVEFRVEQAPGYGRKFIQQCSDGHIGLDYQEARLGAHYRLIGTELVVGIANSTPNFCALTKPRAVGVWPVTPVEKP